MIILWREVFLVMSGLIEEMQALGANVDEAIMRVNNNKALYERMLVKFMNMLKNATATLDSDTSQCEELIEVTHAIKGASGNLSVTPIYEAYSQIVSLLRAGELQQAKKQIQEIRPIQEKIISCIEKYV